MDRITESFEIIFRAAGLGLLLLAGCSSAALTDAMRDGGGADLAIVFASDSSMPPTSDLAAYCADSVLDGDETDVDCGGPTCVACAGGKFCLRDRDCASGTCKSLVCVAVDPCTNQVKDGDETDVDCGGSRCPYCSQGKRCVVDADCARGICEKKACSPARTLTLSFADPLMLATGAGPRGLVVADFNSDGHLDIVVNNKLDSTVTVFLGKGDGVNFGQRVSSGSNQPDEIAVADFNRDGHSDVVLHWGMTDLAVLLGNGDGTFGKPIPSVVPNGQYGSLTAADVDGDKNPDVLIGWTNQIDVYTGDGKGGLKLTSSLPRMDSNNVAGVLAVDLDRDGLLDLAAFSTDVDVLMGMGGGKFAPFVNQPLPSRVFDHNSAAACDLNRDGLLDIATSAGDVLLGKGGGVLGAAATYAVNDTTFRVDIADFDRDGQADLAMVTAHAVLVLRGLGGGQFLQPSVFAGGVPGIVDQAAGDFDGDGKMDLAALDIQARQLYIFPNNSR